MLDAVIYLVEHAGELVPRAVLMKALWPTTVVEDNSLTQLISTLRRALGDDQGGQRLIATVSGRGYQFVGDVNAAGAEHFGENAEGPLPSPRSSHRLSRASRTPAAFAASSSTKLSTAKTDQVTVTAGSSSSIAQGGVVWAFARLC